MPQVDINLWAVAAGVVVSMLLGYGWYSMRGFGRAWMNLIGKTEADLKAGSGSAMGAAVGLAFLTSFVLAHFVAYAGAADALDGMITAAWAWLGFVLTTVTMQNVFAQRPMKLTAINAGYHLVQFVIIGAMLGAWPG